MVWAVLDGWTARPRLQAIAHGDRNAATARVDRAFDEAGATIEDVHFFSGVLTVLGFVVRPDRALALWEALQRTGIQLEPAGEEALRAIAARGGDEITGTLALTFPEGDPDLRREVPAVPG